ncbi:MAG: cell division protein [Rhodospirillaceae bacterium]|jgi:cell division transport system permease protein|nr:cell division protein [Rhodospirillaceae bacterium]MBT5195902.1 cell division protein [Rhodospirillaceae bacterium]MBT5898612.1 cell division protein [Rhodospirillaceae bacterium]MBT6428085.1 cell division protein [Rhodospirillaceae bacterium]MBT7760811.1 cell division protein [Rhodospirillaceae bacterium]
MAGTDLIPDSEGAGRFLPWVVAVMVFFAALASAAGLALNQATGTWRSDLASTITVEIPPQENAQARLTAVTKALRDTPGIARVRPLQVAEIAKLLQPWLGGGALIDDLPLPHLIDVHLSPEQSVDLVALARQLADIGPDIRIDDHQIWLGKLIRLSRSLQWMMLACLAMICFATCAVVIFGTRAAFTAHLEVVSLLHVMGAQDSYIAKLFLRRAMLMGLKGGLIGLAVTAAALYALSRLAADLEGPLFGNLTLTPLGLLSLAALPLLAALLTAMTAWRTVMRELSRMP